jgi:hypothetical protein
MDPVKRRRHCDSKSHIIMHSGALTPLGNLTAVFRCKSQTDLGDEKRNMLAAAGGGAAAGL